MNRRDFIKIAGIGAGTSIAAGCKPVGTDKLVSAIEPLPENIIPGVAHYRESACTECPSGCGVSIRIIDGKTVKLEGTPDHPINDGALCIRGQASITRLYNPERIKTPLIKDGKEWKQAKWEDAYKAIVDAVNASAGNQNVYLSGRTTGTLSGVLDSLATVGITRAPEYEVYDYATIRRANEILFGRNEVPSYNIAQADFLLTVGADIVSTFLSPVEHAKQLTAAKVNNKLRWMHAEPHASNEGMRAELRLHVKPGTEPVLLAFLLGRVASVPAGVPTYGISEAEKITGVDAADLTAAANALNRAKAPLVIAGGVSTDGPKGLETALLAGLLQAATGQLNSSVNFASKHTFDTVGTAADLATLANRMSAGNTGVVFISRTDPVKTAPLSLAFKEAFGKAALRVGIADAFNDTLDHCDVILPASHYLESWGDISPRADISMLIQPSRRPLYDTKTEADIVMDLVEALGGTRPAASYEAMIRSKWAVPEDWDIDGISQVNALRSNPAAASGVTANTAAAAAVIAQGGLDAPKFENALFIAPSLRFYDGRSRLRASAEGRRGLIGPKLDPVTLLEEIPDPLSTITYGEFVSGPGHLEDTPDGLPGGTATSRNQNCQVVRLEAGNWNAEYPSKAQIGLQDHVYSIDRAFISSPDVQIDARTGAAYAMVALDSVADTGRAVTLPVLSGSPSQAGRGIVPNPVHLEKKTGEKITKHEHDPHHEAHEKFKGMTLYPDKEYQNYRWIMSIDTDKCTGCSACVAACYIENNVPMVGKSEHIHGRELSWLRIEPFYDKTKKGVQFLPMLCQHCTNAPCEAVCPVFAAYHNPEGLNAQIYNRCVGTRYCANNCPYKVRRFNWFDPKWQKPLDKMLNPDVSIRTKGAMEKCTFCVQRIRTAKDTAKDENNRLVRDGEVIPACAQTCPSDAIEFGNGLDEKALVVQTVKADGHAHRVLEFLGTEPAVYYLGDITMEEGEDKAHGHG